MVVEFLTERVGYIPGAVNVGVVRAENDRFILIDTGLNDTSGKKAVKAVQELGGSVAAIVTTHAHADHFGANATVSSEPALVSSLRLSTKQSFAIRFCSLHCSMPAPIRHPCCVGGFCWPMRLPWTRCSTAIRWWREGFH